MNETSFSAIATASPRSQRDINRPRNFTVLAGLSAAPDETLMTPHEVATLLNNSRETLRRWGRGREGPPRILVQGRPRYRLGELRHWLSQQPA